MEHAPHLDEHGFPVAAGEFQVEVSLQLKRQLLVDLIVTAFEGGSNYWITRVAQDDGLPLYLLREGAGLTVFHRPDGHVEERAPHPLGESRMAWAVGEVSRLYPRHFAHLAKGGWDADTADVVVQLAVLGEHVYG